ncbi:hypothetical protein F8M41_016922 [Gigaspora margarita]|uniref:Uncharacterized protein n=1 Tax=Gigaspora margarita TaxID=4874 RepID=A0A8H3WVG6_GIGMA|nr:hypothetical protein F8M41_016922 [Gigaspora margarita]
MNYALYQITTLNDLDLNDKLNYKARKALAMALNINSTLQYLNISSKNPRKEPANALHKNQSLAHLDLHDNLFSHETGMALVEVLCKNSTFTKLNPKNNSLVARAGIAIARTIYKIPPFRFK